MFVMRFPVSLHCPMRTYVPAGVPSFRYCGRRTMFVQNIGSPARQSFQRVTKFVPVASSVV